MTNTSDDVGRPSDDKWLPLINLALEESGRFFVTPTEADGEEHSFAPFQLPRLPLSLHCWLVGLGSEFLRRHKRCIAGLLVLDCQERRWLRPVIPAQTCGSDGACWTLDLGGEGPLPASRRIGGSFQVCVATSVMEAATSVPPFDGLHVVQAAGPARDGQFAAYYFLHHSGERSAVLPEEITADDWDQALREASSRMTFE